MTNIQLLKAIGEIDDELAELDDQQPEHKKNSVRYAITAAAACVAIFLASGIAWMLKPGDSGFKTNVVLNEDPMPDAWESIEANSSTSNEDENIAYLLPWEDMTEEQRYTETKFNGLTYSTRQTEISEYMTGEKLGYSISVGIDEYTDTLYDISSEVYEIKGVSSECAVAVKLADYDKLLVYVNSYYRPETLGDLIKDLNLTENVRFGKAYYGYFNPNGDYISVIYQDFDDAVIWEMLLADETLQNVYDDASVFADEFSISVDIPLLGYENISLGVTEDGYITTNILDTGKAFFVGKDKTASFISWVIKNCNGDEVSHIINDSFDNERAAENEMGYYGLSSESRAPSN